MIRNIFGNSAFFVIFFLVCFLFPFFFVGEGFGGVGVGEREFLPRKIFDQKNIIWKLNFFALGSWESAKPVEFLSPLVPKGSAEQAAAAKKRAAGL